MSNAATLPRLTSKGHVLDTSPECLGLMRDSNDILSDGAALRERVKADGYLLLRGVLNQAEVLDARREVMERFAKEGVLDPAYPLIDGRIKPGAQPGFRPDLSNNPGMYKLLYAGPMMELFTRFLGGPVRHYDFTWMRSIPPGGHGINSHLDIVYMGRGTSSLFTAWTPLGDITFEHGGLMILEGSHRNERLKNTYGKKDVDSYCANKTGRAALQGWAFGFGGGLSTNPNQIRKMLSPGKRWLTAEYRAGDVLLFTMFTVHASLDNHAETMRLSTDSRYQLASEPVDERWVGENPPAHGEAGKRGRIC